MLILTLAGIICFGAEPAHRINFDDVATGKLPPAWALHRSSQGHRYTAQVVAVPGMDGKKALEIQQKDYFSFGSYGLVSTRIDAKPYRGQRLRWQLQIKVAAITARSFAAPYLKVHRPLGRPGHWANLNDRGLRANEWQTAQVIVDVADDATEIELGAWLNESGTAYFHTGVLDVIGRAGVGVEPAKPLTERGLTNLIALAKLIGYVRYFHPSDEVASVDWDRLIEAMLPGCEAAATDDALVAEFKRWLLPLAPSVQIGLKSAKLEVKPIELPLGAAWVCWVHDGMASNYQTKGFTSVRNIDRALDLPGKSFGLKKTFPHAPGATGRFELSPTLECLVPQAIPLDKSGTLPKPTANLPKFARSGDFPRTGDDRTTRLVSTILPWVMIQHFYPYFDEVKIDWSVMLAPALMEAATAKDAQEFQHLLLKLSTAFQDGHGAVRGGSGTLANGGALPFSWDIIEKQLVLTSSAGELSAGDIVTAIDGVAIEKALAKALEVAPGATLQFRNYRALQYLRNGPEGSMVKLEVVTPKGKKTFDVKRTWADDSPLRGPGIREELLPALKELEPGYWYFDLDRIDNAQFTKEVIPKLSMAKGIVVDLRGYPKCDTRLIHFLAKKELQWIGVRSWEVAHPNRANIKSEATPVMMPASKQPLNLKAAFLIDGKPVSYGETYADLVAINRLGELVGSPTAGTNGGAQVYALPGGYLFSWTGSKVTQPNGKPFHGLGVQPTLPVERTIKAIREGQDEVIAQGLKAVMK